MLKFKKILPRRLFNIISKFNNNYFDGYCFKSYSQEGEDMILRRIFESQESGFYVDIGAHHPKRFSNTYFFYKKGWTGINIDAMPGSMEMFNKLRPKDINVEKPISSYKQVLSYYGFNEPALNGFSEAISKSRDGLNNYKIIFIKKIETTTLEEVLDSKLEKNQVIDFMSVDVEGLDFDVIKSLNFDKYLPRILLVEMLGSSISALNDDECYNFLLKKGYWLYAKTINTFIFKSKFF